MEFLFFCVHSITASGNSCFILIITVVTPPVGLESVVVLVFPRTQNDEHIDDCDRQPDPQRQHQIISWDVKVVSFCALQLEAKHNLKSQFHQDATYVPGDQECL